MIPFYILQATAEYLVRVSFGTALIASIVLVYTTIIAIVSSRRYLLLLYWRTLQMLVLCLIHFSCDHQDTFFYYYFKSFYNMSNTWFSEEDNRGRRGRSYDSGFAFYFSPTDLFW